MLLANCLNDLESHGHLLRIKQEIDPYLEMALIQRRVFAANGPAILFERVKGSPFPAVSNLFGSSERWRFIFRKQLRAVEEAICLKAKPEQFISRLLKNFGKDPLPYCKLPWTAYCSLPKKVPFASFWRETSISQLPQLHCWPKDGGAFITLPQVFTRQPGCSRILSSNMGMYRVQLSGGEYIADKEIGLHYQIHRGIGVHHTAALSRNEDLAVTIFVGGHPAHTLAAVMPLPEGMSELLFAGMLAGRRFRYSTAGNHIISDDADFCILGWIRGQKTKPEGPFGDHLGYYSLTHDFPVLEVEKVYYRPGAIWPFTVVGRPPQEDSMFGQIIHELTKPMVPRELPGVFELHAVDEAGVHPLLLAIGSERYTPYQENNAPSELLTQANSILGFGQCSLAKYLIIANINDNSQLHCNEVEQFFSHVLERVDWRRDLHFQTCTSIDTLDYSGESLNRGSKLVIAASGRKLRTLSYKLPNNLNLPLPFNSPQILIPGILVIQCSKFISYQSAEDEINKLSAFLSIIHLEGFPLITIADDSIFTGKNLANWLWVTFTRSNPSHDIYGERSFINYKHWGTHLNLIIDARQKPQHAPSLEEDPKTLARVDTFFAKGGPLDSIKE